MSTVQGAGGDDDLPQGGRRGSDGAGAGGGGGGGGGGGIVGFGGAFLKSAKKMSKKIIKLKPGTTSERRGSRRNANEPVVPVVANPVAMTSSRRSVSGAERTPPASSSRPPRHSIDVPMRSASQSSSYHCDLARDCEEDSDEKEQDMEEEEEQEEDEGEQEMQQDEEEQEDEEEQDGGGVYDGSPHDSEPLVGYKTHRAKAWWPGMEGNHEMKILRRIGRMKEVMSWSKEPIVPGSWYQFASLSGLTAMESISFKNVDHALIEAFIVHWHPETNSFHFPWGEMTITLHDVYMLMGLRIDGNALITPFPDASRKDFLRLSYGYTPQELLDVKTGIHHVQFDNKIKLLICQRRIHPLAQASAYLLSLIGVVFINDRSTTHVPLWVLDLVHDHNVTGAFAWGAGFLAYLYRCLGEASREGMSTMGGCTALLQYWIWAHFHQFAPSSSGVDLRTDPRWAVRFKDPPTPTKTMDKVREYIHDIESMSAGDVTFMPYQGVTLDFDGPFRVSRYRGLLRIGDIREPYMSDRVVRQFGYVQGIPEDRLKPFEEERPLYGKLKLKFHDIYEKWGNRHSADSMISFDGLPRAWIPSQVDPEYMAWFMEHGHPFILLTSMTRPLPPVPPVHTIYTRRLFTLGERLSKMMDHAIHGGETIVSVDEIKQYYDEAFSMEDIPTAPTQVRASQQHQGRHR